MQRATVDHTVTGKFTRGLIAPGEIVQHGGNALRLHAAHPFRRESAAEIRVLPEAIRQRAVKRTAHHARVGREQRAVAALYGKAADGSAHLAHKLPVEGAAQCARRRHTDAVCFLVVTVNGVKNDAVRSVRYAKSL